MTTPRDPDEILAVWLDQGPTRLPDQTRRAIAVALPLTSQRRRAVSVPWRYPMSSTFRLAVGAMAVIAVVLGGAFVLTPRPPGGSVGGAPTQSPLPTASSTPSPSAAATPVDTTGWVPFSSARYGYAISHPSGWYATQSTRAWSLEVDQHDWLTSAADVFVGSRVRFTVFAAPVPAGMSSDAWITTYFRPDATASPGVCVHGPEDLGPITVDGHPATFWAETEIDDCGGTFAFVPVDDRVYVFTVWLGGYEPLLKAYVSTVRFQPVADPSASPSAS